MTEDDGEPATTADRSSGYDPSYLGGRSQAKRGFSGCLAVIVALAVVLGGAYVVGSKGFHYLKDQLSLGGGLPGPGPRPGAASWSSRATRSPDRPRR